MKKAEFEALKPGDLIRHKDRAEAYVVHFYHWGSRTVTAARIVTPSNPVEWDRLDEHGAVVSTDD